VEEVLEAWLGNKNHPRLCRYTTLMKKTVWLQILSELIYRTCIIWNVKCILYIYKCIYKPSQGRSFSELFVDAICSWTLKSRGGLFVFLFWQNSSEVKFFWKPVTYFMPRFWILIYWTITLFILARITRQLDLD
jgi:hypothetical protein